MPRPTPFASILYLGCSTEAPIRASRALQCHSGAVRDRQLHNSLLARGSLLAGVRADRQRLPLALHRFPNGRLFLAPRPSVGQSQRPTTQGAYGETLSRSAPACAAVSQTPRQAPCATDRGGG